MVIEVVVVVIVIVAAVMVVAEIALWLTLMRNELTD